MGNKIQGVWMLKAVNKEIRRDSNLNSLLLLIFLIVTVGGGLLLRALRFGSPYDSPFRNDKLMYAVCECVVYLVLIPLLIWLFQRTAGRRKGLSLRDTLRKPRRSFGWCLKWVVIAVGVSQTVARPLVLLLSLFGVNTAGSTGNSQVITSTDDVFGYVLYAVPLLFAPILEELLFRACLFRNTEGMGQWFAAIVTGMLFGLWHGNLSQFIMASVFGMFCCLILIKTRSLFVTMAAHFLNNMLVFVLAASRSFISTILQSRDVEFVLHALFVKNTVPSVIFTLGLLLVFGISAAGTVLFIVELIRKRRRLALKPSVYPLHPVQRALVYFSAPVTIIIMLLLVAQVVISMTL